MPESRGAVHGTYMQMQADVVPVAASLEQRIDLTPTCLASAATLAARECRNDFVNRILDACVGL